MSILLSNQENQKKLALIYGGACFCLCLASGLLAQSFKSRVIVLPAYLTTVLLSFICAHLLLTQRFAALVKITRALYPTTITYIALILIRALIWKRLGPVSYLEAFLILISAVVSAEPMIRFFRIVRNRSSQKRGG